MTIRIVKSFQGEGPRLYICSTPIGNLQDTSMRLVDVLRSVDVVAAEDTRQTRKLLTHFDIHPPLVVSCHEHNQVARQKDFEHWWSEGKSVALVSDAGTPLVSDPGDSVVQFAIQHGIPVVPVPGASAVLAALVGSGTVPQPFTFLGFLPRDKRQAKDVLLQYHTVPGALVIYEAPHRLLHTLRVIEEVCQGRPVTLAKELTKRHETFYYAASVQELLAHFETESPRGEYVMVLGPREVSEKDESEALQDAQDQQEAAVARVRELMQEGMPHTAAVKYVAAEMGLRRKDLYQQTLHEEEEES